MLDLNSIDTVSLREQLNQDGFTIVKKVLTKGECQSIIKLYEAQQFFRKTIEMERSRFGVGQYKYLNYPLPELIQKLRQNLYPYLYTIANSWSKSLRLNIEYPAIHQEFLNTCKKYGQTLATPLILKYHSGGHNTLHQDMYGEIYFPLQAVVCLNQPDEDFEGGEFVITEQVPRAQSKANVLKPRQGDIIIFATRFRPKKGVKGYYRANMKHGISKVQSGVRHTLGIIFHDAQ